MSFIFFLGGGRRGGSVSVLQSCSGGAPSASSYPPLCIQLIKVPQHEDFDSCCDFCLLFCYMMWMDAEDVEEEVVP